MPKNISEDEQGGVTIDGQNINGHIDEDTRCNTCGGPRIYYEDYDAYFCPECNLWLSGVCGDRFCEYCRRRPERPLPPVERVEPWRDRLQRLHYVPLILLFAGLLLSVYGGVKLASSSRFVRNAESTDGTIVSQRWVYDWPERVFGEGPLRMVTVEFRTADSGQVVRFEVGDSQLHVGEQVKVIYNPANPSQAKIDEGVPGYSMSLIPLGLGIVFLVSGLLCFKR